MIIYNMIIYNMKSDLQLNIYITPAELHYILYDNFRL